MATLRETADSKNISIGACVDYNTWNKDREYKKLISREFNRLTPENCLKWEYIRPEKGEFNFEKPDKLVEFAEENEMKVTGHSLLWHNQNPEWLEKGGYNSEEMEEILTEHIEKVVTHYSGKIDAWDVVNEAVNDQAELRKSIWLKSIGKEYIETAFREANKHSDARLFYNDYGLLYDKEKRERVYQLLSKLLDRGVPIEGIGLQSISLAYTQLLKKSEKVYRSFRN